jgi:hypothetical protein
VIRRLRRGFVAGLATFVLALSVAPATFADDGEIGDNGDTDSITDIFVQNYNGNDRVTVKIDYPHDCPPGLSCQIEVQFEHKCPEAWCFGYGAQSYRTLPLPTNGVSTIRADCMPDGDEDNYWQMSYRVRWWAPQVYKVQLWGELEGYTNVNGSFLYKRIPETGFNVTLNGGLKAGAMLDETTASSKVSNWFLISTSGGVVLHSC